MLFDLCSHDLCLVNATVLFFCSFNGRAFDARGILGAYCRHRMAGKRPLTVVAWLALTSGAVPRSMSLTCANVPTTATKIAPMRLTTTIFKWVLRLALYIK